MKRIALVLLIISSISCSTQRQLRKAYVGEPFSKVEMKFDQPKTVIEQEGEKLYIFEKTEELASTEIGQGQLTLDPIITPKVIKTERYYFTVKNGTVIKARFEEDYERK